MAFFHKKSPWEIEWADLAKREAKFAAKRREGPTSVLVQKLDRFVPDKLSGTLNAAFLKAFEIIFEKGTGVIEKTYNKGKRETDFKVNTYAAQVREDRKTVRNFTKQAKSAKSLNLAIASIEGIGLGFVGAGIPDIPLFIAMVLKSVYEIALSYGYSYDTDEEKIFILKVIEAAMCDEEAFREKKRSSQRGHSPDHARRRSHAGGQLEGQQSRADEGNLRLPVAGNDLYQISAGTICNRHCGRYLRSDLCQSHQRLRGTQISQKILRKQKIRLHRLILDSGRRRIFYGFSRDARAAGRCFAVCAGSPVISSGTLLYKLHIKEPYCHEKKQLYLIA